MAIDVGKFMKSPEFEIKLTTYRDIFQVQELEFDRFGQEYKKLSAAVFMSKDDMKKLGFRSADRVRLSNNYGSIVVKVRETKRDEPGGLAFMINSPWSNSLVSDDTGGKGIPEFKNITARISLSREDITPIEKLFLPLKPN